MMSVRFTGRLEAAEKKLSSASSASAAALAAMFRDAVLKVSKRNQNSLVTGIIAMGTYYITIERPGNPNGETLQGSEYDVVEETYDHFDRIIKHYGWGATPAPLKLQAQNGKLIVNTTDW